MKYCFCVALILLTFAFAKEEESLIQSDAMSEENTDQGLTNGKSTKD